MKTFRNADIRQNGGLVWPRRFAGVLVICATVSTFCGLVCRSSLGQQEIPLVPPQQEKPAEPPAEPPAEQKSENNEPLDPKAAVEAIYKMTVSANTWEEYDVLVKLCQKRRADLPPQQAAYVKRLLGWSQNRRGQEYAQKAGKAMENGDAETATDLEKLALEDFNASIRNDPRRWKAYHNRGVSLAMQGRFDDAIQDFDKAIELFSGYANTWFNRGEVRYKLGRFEKAIEDYTRALSLETDAAIFTSRGHTLYEFAMQQKNPGQRRRYFQNALSDFNRAVELDEKNAEYFANRADALQTFRYWGRALSDYVQAVTLDPKLARAYQGAGWLMATCPDQRYRSELRASQYAQRAIDLGGKENYLHLDTLAAAYANANDFAQAQKTITQALAIAPEDAAEKLQQRQQLYDKKQPYRQ